MDLQNGSDSRVLGMMKPEPVKICVKCKKFPAITDCGRCTSCYMAKVETEATAERKGKAK